MCGDGGGRLRADARRNRDRILRTARVLFTEQGVHVPMEEIARRSGVGVGTLYRRFPDRTALNRALAMDTVRLLDELTRSATAEEPDSWHALRRFVLRCIDLRLDTLKTVIDPQVNAALRGDDELEAAQLTTNELLERLVSEAQADGDLRADVGVGDVTALISLLVCAPVKLPAEMSGVTRARFAQIMLDGLRAGAPSPLPSVPLATDTPAPSRNRGG